MTMVKVVSPLMHLDSVVSITQRLKCNKKNEIFQEKIMLSRAKDVSL